MAPSNNPAHCCKASHLKRQVSVRRSPLSLSSRLPPAQKRARPANPRPKQRIPPQALQAPTSTTMVAVPPLNTQSRLSRPKPPPPSTHENLPQPATVRTNLTLRVCIRHPRVPSMEVVPLMLLCIVQLGQVCMKDPSQARRATLIVGIIRLMWWTKASMAL